jgi:tetratricopeptide (TPR) repeat protein
MQAAGLEEWKLALSAENRRHLTLYEELRIRGLYASDTWDYQGAEAAFARLEEAYPRDYLASFYLAHSILMQGRLDSAVSEFLAADRKRPNSSAVLSNLAGAYLWARRYPELDATVAHLRSLKRETAACRYSGLKSFCQKQYADSLVWFQRCSEARDSSIRSRGFADRAAVLAELGRYAEAEAALRDGIRADSQAGRTEMQAGKVLALAYLALRQSWPEKAHSLASEGAAMDPSPHNLLRSGVLQARAGYIEDATKVLRQLQRGLSDTSLGRIMEAHIQGEIAMASGHASDAVTAFRTASEIEPRLRLRAYLARGLAAAGDPAGALQLYRSIVDTPEYLWQSADYDFPGELTDSTWEYARLAARDNQKENARYALGIYLERRGTSILPEVRAAKELAAKLSQ